MHSCALHYCKTRYDKQIERTFSLFSFPSGDTEAHDKWIQFVRAERSENYWLPSAASKLCSKHFKSQDMYRGKTGRIILKKGSVPCKSTNDNKTERDSEAATVTPLCGTESDSNSTLDSSRKTTLKYQAYRLEQQNRHHQIRIRKLDQQNIYLKNKISRLKDSVVHLQKKFNIQKNVIKSLKACIENHGTKNTVDIN